MQTSSQSSRLRGRLGTLATGVVVTAIACAFWVPAWANTRGYFPAPLDDVYIHFDFARSLGSGHPFEWIAGNGYSSGETSPLYAVVLALGWLLGFRDRMLGLWAALVAVAAVTGLLRSVQRLTPGPAVVAWFGSTLVLAVGLADWTLFSGMEVAVFACALGPTLEAVARSRRAARSRTSTREASAWAVGGWLGVLVLLRPEAVALAPVFALVVARGAGPRSGLAAFARAVAPPALTAAALGTSNFLATGDFASAGARLKLLSSNPFLSDTDRARAFTENVITFAWKGLRPAFAGGPIAPLALGALVIAALARPVTRPPAAAAVAGAAAWTLLVSVNGNAPFHNFRYYAPALLLVLAAAAMGVGALASARRLRCRTVLALTCAGVLLTGGLARLGRQTDHFARAAANIRGQHVEVGLRLAAMPGMLRVLVGDAGAIPFVSRKPAMDALGLGGFDRMPFARAAVHGEAAIVELLERVPVAQRPTHMALYPNWFGAITRHFGTELDRVTITDNVVCGGPTKVIFLADWSALAVPDVTERTSVDEIDVADVVSEHAHAYEAPFPLGFTAMDVLATTTGTKRFDGGRIIPEGANEAFVVHAPSRGKSWTIVVRTDEGTRAIRAHAGGRSVDLALAPPRPGAWREATGDLGVLGPEPRVVLEATSGPYRNFHVWIVEE